MSDGFTGMRGRATAFLWAVTGGHRAEGIASLLRFRIVPAGGP